MEHILYHINNLHITHKFYHQSMIKHIHSKMIPIPCNRESSSLVYLYDHLHHLLSEQTIYFQSKPK